MAAPMSKQISTFSGSKTRFLKGIIGKFMKDNDCKRSLNNVAIRNGFAGMVGRTPLVRLRKLSEETGCEILVKAEFANPGGSVKDRSALYLIKDAEKKGRVRPGGTIVESTGGNTGIGLAHLCRVLGYKCVIFIPENKSIEKVEAMRALGAEVHRMPVVAIDNPRHFTHMARLYGENNENTVWTDQFDNLISTQAHYETTGPEIWSQTGGKVHAVVFATGTAGTLAGVGMYLKEQRKDIHVILADSQGGASYNWIKHGILKKNEGKKTIAEGTGRSYVTNNLKGALVDDALFIKDTQLLPMTFRLLHEEGFFVGPSSGLNVEAAVQVAKQLGPGHTVVTCFCDSGHRYFQRLCNREFLQTQGLLGCLPEQYHKYLH